MRSKVGPGSGVILWRLPLCLLLVVGMSSCDLIKSKLLAWVKASAAANESVAEAAAEPVPQPAAKPEGKVVGYDAGPVVRPLSAGGFAEFTGLSNRVVVIDYHAHWCPPCRRLGPMLDRLVRGYDGRVLLGTVDIDQNRDLARQQGVSSIPDVRIYLNGRQVDRFVGALPEAAIRAKLDRQVASLLPEVVVDVDIPAEVRKSAVEPMTREWMPQGMEKR